MKNKIIIFLVLVFLPSLAEAQCSMCRAVLESEDSHLAAQGINDGIVYLMLFPYLLIGGIAFFIYRSFKNKKSSTS